LKKRIHLLTHVIMILLITLILFPVVWVVMTSIRRDNAAFSPKLFSSNITLQHYKDLVIPPKNVPVLISELGDAVSLSKPFKSNIEKTAGIIESDIQRLFDYISDTENVSKKLERSADYLEKDAKSSARKTLETFRMLLPDILKTPEKIDPISAIYVEKHLGKNGSWIKSLVSEKDYSEYEKSIGSLLKKEEYLRKSMEKLKTEIISLKDQLSKESMKVVNILSEIEIIESDLKKINNILKSLLKIPEGTHPNLENILTDAESLLKKTENFRDLVELKETLVNIIQNLKSLRISRDSEDAFKSVKLQLSTAIRDAEIQVDELNEVYEKMINLEKQLSSKIKEYEIVQKDLADVMENIKKFQRGHLEDIRNAYLAYLRWRLLGIANFPEMIQKWESDSIADIAKIFGIRTFINVKKCLIKMRKLKREDLDRKKKECTVKIMKEIDDITVLSKLNNSIRKELSYLESFGIADTQLTVMMNDSEWASDYLKFKNSSKNLISYLQILSEKLRKEVRSLSNRWRALLDISKSGIPVVPSEVTEMNELLSTVYESKVSGALGITIREAIALENDFPVERDRKIFKEIDSMLYSLQQIWKKKPKHFFLRWVMNSVIVAGVVAIITTIITALAAYPFSRMRFLGRRYGIMALLLIQMFPSIMYMVALYGMLAFLGKIIPWIGLDTLGGLIFVYLGNIAFNMFLIKGFYDTIPSSLEESAMIDGATRFQTFWRIILPLAKPILAVVLILTFMGTFNEYVLARIILQDVKKYTYALGLWQFTVGPFETEWGLFTAAALLGMIPMVALFLSMQRFLISGLTKGAVKG